MLLYILKTIFKELAWKYFDTKDNIEPQINEYLMKSVKRDQNDATANKSDLILRISYLFIYFIILL